MAATTFCLPLAAILVALALAPHTASALGRYQLVKINLSWQDATNYCRNNGILGLVSFDSWGELDSVTSGAIAQGMQEGYGMWTTATDVGWPGTFFYSSTGGTLPFNAWNGGEPNNAGGVEHCMEAVLRGGVLRWNDNNCNNGRWFMCK